MDSISQGVLGWAVSGLIGWKKMGKKAYRRGIFLGTVPDLDVFVWPLLYSDPLQAMFFHRWPTHSIIFAFLAAPIFAYVINKIHKWDKSSRWTWTVIAFFAFFTHALLDSLTNYGTKLLWPFTDIAYSFNSIFIVDPLYTLPFLVLFLIALFVKARVKAWKINARWVWLSTIYLIIGLVLKFTIINPIMNQAIAEKELPIIQSFTTPEVWQILLRRQVAITNDDFIQWRYSILDSQRTVDYISVPRMTALLDPYRNDPSVQKLLERTQWYYLVRSSDQWWVTLVDVRFGWLNGWEDQEDNFVFGYSIYEENWIIRVGDRNRWDEWRSLPDDVLKVWRERVKGI